jgi:hypothetical protein
MFFFCVSLASGGIFWRGRLYPCLLKSSGDVYLGSPTWETHFGSSQNILPKDLNDYPRPRTRQCAPNADMVFSIDAKLLRLASEF